jgi:hypothetical protein
MARRAGQSWRHCRDLFHKLENTLKKQNNNMFLKVIKFFSSYPMAVCIPGLMSSLFNGGFNNANLAWSFWPATACH